MSSIQRSLIRQIFEGASGDSINMALGEPVFNKPDWFINSINPKVMNTFSYTPNAGLIEAREAVNEINSYPQNPDHICLVCGAEEGLFASISGIKLMDTKRRKLLIPSPYFLTYPTIANIVGMPYATYPIPPFFDGSIFESIKANFTDDMAGIIVNSPGNPAGNLISQKELKQIEAFCMEKNVILLVDEVYRYFGNRELPVSHEWDEVGKNTVIISSVTKNYGLPGLRLGWAYTSHELINYITVAHQSITAIASSLSQQLVAEFPKYNYKAWLESNRNKTISNREKLIDILRKYKIEFIEPKGAFYILIKIPQAVSQIKSDVDVAFYLRDEYKILLVPGMAFGEYSKNTMRLSFGGNDSDFEEAIRRIRKGFDSLID